MDELRLIIHFRIMPEGNFDIANSFLSTIVMEVSVYYSPFYTVTPFIP
jgi:hypothetical protein